MWFEPNMISLTRGSAEGYTSLNAFDNALLQGRIGNLNLVKVSSIIPPKAKFVPLPLIPDGFLVPAVCTHISSNVPGEIISACIGAGLADGSCGLIMEYSHKGPAEVAQEIVSRMIEEGFRVRGFQCKEIKFTTSEHTVERLGCAMAAAILWRG